MKDRWERTWQCLIFADITTLCCQQKENICGMCVVDFSKLNGSNSLKKSSQWHNRHRGQTCEHLLSDLNPFNASVPQCFHWTGLTGSAAPPVSRWTEGTTHCNQHFNQTQGGLKNIWGMEAWSSSVKRHLVHTWCLALAIVLNILHCTHININT